MIMIKNTAVPFMGQMEISAGNNINLKTSTNDVTDKQFIQPFDRLFKINPDSLKLAAGEDTFYTSMGDGNVFYTKGQNEITIKTSNVMPFPFFNFSLTMNPQNTSVQVLQQAHRLFDEVISKLRIHQKD